MYNYATLLVLTARAEGSWITNIEGRCYLDCLAAYSAVNFSHRNPEITAVAHAQLDTVVIVESSLPFRQCRTVLRCACLGV